MLLNVNHLKKNRTKCVWDSKTLKKFVDVCMIEFNKMNRNGGHFNKIGWEK